MPSSFGRMLDDKRLANLPQAAEWDEYETAVADYMAKIRGRAAPRAVLRFGTFGVPGLSDIDLVVVLGEGTKRDFIHRYSIAGLSEKARYLFSHDPLLIDEAGYRDIRLWFPVKHIYPLSGEPMLTDDSWSENRALKAIHLAQMLLMFQLPLLAQFTYFSPEINVRVSENVVKGFCNSLELWKGMHGGHVDGRYSDFQGRYEAFRKSWFSLPDQERHHRFKEFLAETTELTFFLIGDMGKFLDGWLKVESKPSLEFILNGGSYRFDGEWTSDRCRDFFFGRQQYYFPSAFAFLLAAYRRTPGIVGRNLSKIMPPVQAAGDIFRDPEAAKVFSRHVAALDHYGTYVTEKFRIPANPFVTFGVKREVPFLQRKLDSVINRCQRKFFSNG